MMLPFKRRRTYARVSTQDQTLARSARRSSRGVTWPVIWASPGNMEKIRMTEQTAPSREPEPVRPTVEKSLPKEIGGVKGPEPTRYGDWEHKGRCADF
jgi:hypothetical protein